MTRPMAAHSLRERYVAWVTGMPPVFKWREQPLMDQSGDYAADCFIWKLVCAGYFELPDDESECQRLMEAVSATKLIDQQHVLLGRKVIKAARHQYIGHSELRPSTADNDINPFYQSRPHRQDAPAIIDTAFHPDRGYSGDDSRSYVQNSASHGIRFGWNPMSWRNVFGRFPTS